MENNIRKRQSSSGKLTGHPKVHFYANWKFEKTPGKIKESSLKNLAVNWSAKMRLSCSPVSKRMHFRLDEYRIIPLRMALFRAWKSHLDTLILQSCPWLMLFKWVQVPRESWDDGSMTTSGSVKTTPETRKTSWPGVLLFGFSAFWKKNALKALISLPAFYSPFLLHPMSWF